MVPKLDTYSHAIPAMQETALIAGLVLGGYTRTSPAPPE
jgi:hypothetical protein